MSDALANFATTGKLNFKGLVASILTDLAKMEMRIAMSKILQQVLGYFIGPSTGQQYT
jgi:lambda family phage tail tape measure protein